MYLVHPIISFQHFTREKTTAKYLGISRPSCLFLNQPQKRTKSCNWPLPLLRCLQHVCQRLGMSPKRHQVARWPHSYLYLPQFFSMFQTTAFWVSFDWCQNLGKIRKKQPGCKPEIAARELHHWFTIIKWELRSRGSADSWVVLAELPTG